MGYLSRLTLEGMGFASIGNNVAVSDKASIYNCSAIALGDDVRIDDFCVLSAGAGGISIGSNVHVAAFSLLVGAGRITLADFSGISSRVSIYSSTDDYSGASMTNPTVPSEFTGVQHGDVTLGKHVIVGSGTVILPGAVLEDGVAVGALSVVKGHCAAFGVYVGNPAKRLKSRKRDVLELETRFLASKNK